MNTPIIKEEEAGNVAWCSCGRSKNQPYCDGSHVGTDSLPVMVTIESKKEVAWCGCKCTENAL